MDYADLKMELEQEQRDLENQLTKLSDEHAEQSLREATGELSAYDQHPADLASELMERDTDFALKEQKRIRLAEVEAALRRLDAGDYGICERCGRSIPRARLAAVPTAKYCLECEEWAEQEGVERMRPVEEEVIAFHDFSDLSEEIDETD